MTDLEKTPSLRVSSHRTPFSWLTPTHLAFDPNTSTSPTGSTWQSRRARKGRYTAKDTHVTYAHPHQSDGAKKVVMKARIAHPGVKLKPGLWFDISWWLAFTFTLGSAIWVVNGFLVWFPILRPTLDTPSFSHAAAATAFVGASVFEVGAYLGIIEVLVRGQEIKDTPLEKLLHHRRKFSSSDLEVEKGHLPQSQLKKEEAEVKVVARDMKGWVWWGRPMWHDMGYLAAIVQMFAATIFWVSSLTGLPGVIPGFADGGGSLAIIDIFFWTPQVVGGTGFIVSSGILLLEVQKKWYKPALKDIGWHVAFWNLVGAIGFTLCGSLGYSDGSGEVYQSGLATWWGSWGFMIGSTLQLIEASFRET